MPSVRKHIDRSLQADAAQQNRLRVTAEDYPNHTNHMNPGAMHTSGYDTVRLPLAMGVPHQAADAVDANLQQFVNANTPFKGPGQGQGQGQGQSHHYHQPTPGPILMSPSQQTTGGFGNGNAAGMGADGQEETSIQRQVRLAVTLKEWVRRSSAQELAGIRVRAPHPHLIHHLVSFYTEIYIDVCWLCDKGFR